MLESDQVSFLSDIRRSARYHEHRISFFTFWHQVTSFLTILLSGSVLLQISDSNFKMAWWLTAMSVSAAILAALDMVVGFAKMADIHKNLKRRYCMLEDQIVKATSNDNFGSCYSERLRIEMDEPPIYSALDLVCRNEQAAADGNNDSSRYFILPWYVYITRNHIRWPNIAHSSPMQFLSFSVGNKKIILTFLFVSILLGLSFIAATTHYNY